MGDSKEKQKKKKTNKQANTYGQSRSVYLPGWKQNEEKVAYLCLII